MHAQLSHSPDSDVDRLIGASAAMRYVPNKIARAAERSVHVLLSGEAGTGRQIIAQAIHAQSRHCEGPFVAIDCGKISAQDLEAQLFPTNGNHSGAERRCVERVRRSSQLLLSQGGTLFLQNIVDLPARVQARLVRVPSRMRDCSCGPLPPTRRS